MRASDKIVKIRRKIFQSKSVIGFGCSDLPDSNSILRTTSWASRANRLVRLPDPCSITRQ